MKENVQKEIIKNQKKLALTVLAVLIAGIFLEIFCNLPLIRANSGKNQGSSMKTEENWYLTGTAARYACRLADVMWTSYVIPTNMRGC